MYKNVFVGILILLLTSCTVMEYQQVKKEHERKMEEGDRQLKELEKERGDLQSEKSQLERDREKLIAERNKQREKLAALDAELDDLRENIHQKELTTAAKKQEAQRYEWEIGQLKEQIVTLQRDTELSVEEREAKIKELNNEIDTLFALIEGL